MMSWLRFTDLLRMWAGARPPQSGQDGGAGRRRHCLPHAVTSAMEAGVSMAGGFSAPARRVGGYLTAADALTADGWKLFDYAVDYADGKCASGRRRGRSTRSPGVRPSAVGRRAVTPFPRLGRWTTLLYTSWGDCGGHDRHSVAKVEHGAE